MPVEKPAIDVKEEAAALTEYLVNGDPCSSICLARLIEADQRGAFRPFAEALAARLRDHLHRWAELGVTDPEQTLDDEVYQLLKRAAADWDGFPCEGRDGEEA